MIILFVHDGILYHGSEIPPVDLVATFPYLCDKKMSDRELRRYRMKLYKETVAIKSKFDSLVFNLQQTVEKAYQVKDIARLLRSHEKEFEKPLRECATVSDVFDNAELMWSFYNYVIVKSLINHLGTDSNRKQMQSYITEFREYAKNRLVCECPINAFGDKEVMQSEEYFAVKTDKSMDSFSLEELDDMEFEINRILGRKLLRLLCIEKGCVRLIFRLIFRSLSKDVMDLSLDQQMMLRRLGVLRISYGDRSMDMPELEVPSTKNDSECTHDCHCLALLILEPNTF